MSRPNTASSPDPNTLQDNEVASRPRAGHRTPQAQTTPTSPSRTAEAASPAYWDTLLGSPDDSRRPFAGTSSRPTSPAGSIGKSHVPSLAAQGFLRPMSSQRLQAQRQARPGTAKTRHSVSPEAEETQEFDEGTHSSPGKGEKSPAFSPLQQMDRPPPSRGTECSDREIPDRAASASPQGHAGARSLGDSVRLLNERAASKNVKKPPLLGLPMARRSNDPSENLSRSSRSYHSGLSLGSKRESTRQQVEPGHQHLPSTAESSRFDATQKPAITQQKEFNGKNYEYFPGNTAFGCGGRLQNARDRPVNIATGIMVVLPAILFGLYTAPWLWRNVSPVIPILFAYVFFLCASSFLHASAVDPGILPRNINAHPPPDPKADPLALGPPMSDWVTVRSATSDTTAMDLPVKYCKTCNIWRPPRCYHCRICDNCVETLDHHCVWLNNCVGRRNYRYFFAFVGTVLCLALLLIYASLHHCISYSVEQGISFGEAIDELRIPFAMVIYGMLGATYPISLMTYHLYIMGRGETTRERLNSKKFPPRDRHRVFSQGSVLKNWIAVLARPRPPTYLHLKYQHEEGDQRFGPQRRKTATATREDEESQGNTMEMKAVSGGKKGFEGPASRKEDRPQ